MNIKDPYADAGNRWLKGVTHAHVDKGKKVSSAVEASPLPEYTYKNGEPASTIYTASKAENFNFVCMSVHVTKKNEGVHVFGNVGSSYEDSVTGIPGREIQNDSYPGYFSELTSKWLHVLTIGDTNGLTICCHPLYYQVADVKPDGEGDWKWLRKALLNPDSGGHLEELGICGIEVYNGFTESRLKKPEQYTDFAEGCWDDILLAGHLYWGFTGNDSFFGRKDVYSSFNPLGVMHAAVPQGQSLEDLVSAFREGRSYASTGIELTDTPLSATVNGDTLTIDVSARTTVDWTAKSYIPGSSGPTTQTVNGRESASFTIDGNWKFVRVQCQDPGNTKSRAWLQPIMNLDYSG